MADAFMPSTSTRMGVARAGRACCKAMRVQASVAGSTGIRQAS